MARGKSFILKYALGFLIGVAVGMLLIHIHSIGQKADAEMMPSDTLQESDIRLYKDKVVIDIEGAQVRHYLDTGSMIPVMHDTVNTISVNVTSEDELEVGDIAAYQPESGESLMTAHRIIGIGEDASGVYYIFQGDNNALPDEGKVRLDQIKYKVVAIIY